MSSLIPYSSHTPYPMASKSRWLGFQSDLFLCVCVCVLSHVCSPMDCSLLGSSSHGISQARILEWVAIFFFRGSSWPKDQTCFISCISCLGRQIIYHRITWEAPSLNHLQETECWCPLPNSYVEILTLKVMELRHGIKTVLKAQFWEVIRTWGWSPLKWD